MLTRAEFLRIAGLTSVGALLPRRLMASARLVNRDKVATLFEKTFVIDGNVQPGPRRAWFDKAGAVKSRTGIDCAPMTVAERNLGWVNRKIKQHSSAYRLVTSAKDLTKTDDRHAIIIYFQKNFTLDPQGRKLEQWAHAGLRILQFAYADAEQLGGGVLVDAPLTKLGEGAVFRCNQLGIAIDASHCCGRTTLGICERSSKPVTANHCNTSAVAPMRRNKRLVELKAIAKTGGVVGIMPLGRYLRRRNADAASVDDVIAHIDHLVSMVGIDHVGIASDSWLDGEGLIAPLATYGRWMVVADRLFSKGYQSNQLAKIFGGNFQRAYSAAFAGR